MAYMYNYFLSKRVYDKNRIDFGKLLFSDEAIRKLLIPLIIENLLTSLMGMADSMMVTRIGSAAISAVSLTDSINVLIIQMLSALATGGAIVCSQYIGAGDIKRANAAARQVLVVVLTISSALTFVCELLNRPLLRLIFGQVEPDVMHYAVIYFLFTGFSFPFMGLYQAGAAFFRAGGDSKFPMQISIISNILNIIGNYIFIFICGWGVAGAALSTLLSRIFCALVVLAALRRPVHPIVVKNYLSIRPDFNMIQKILTIGIPAGIENSMFQFGKLAIQSSVSTLGTTSIAAQAMTVIFENLNGIAGGAIGLGLMTITGQTIGAGRREEAKYYVLKLMDIGEASIIFSCALVFAVCKPVMLLAGMEPAAARECFMMMIWITIVKPLIWVPSFIPPYAFRSAGDVRYPMLVSTLSMWFMRVFLTTLLILHFGFGPIAVWIGMFSDWFIRGVCYLTHLLRGHWMKHQVI